MVETLTTFALPEVSKNEFKDIVTNELSYLVSLFRENKFEIKIAGGAVRDLLMGLTPHDIDFATDATPLEMKERFTKNNLRLINTNGDSHGTITTRINDKENFEITTLKYDKVTDGRRAEVVFTKDWKIDAERRDLTINSMLLDMDGVVYDYFNGKSDIDTRTVKFVGDASKRIQEDYLRILRYFRFYGRISTNPDDHIVDTLNKIREHSEGLQRVSGERIWLELRKIICGNFVPQIIDRMKNCELFRYIGLPEKTDLSELKNRYSILKKNNCHPAVIMSTILLTGDHLSVAIARLKFSNDDFTYVIYGKISKYIWQEGTLSEEEASKFVNQILLGVNHIHSKNILHLDLKPENILVEDVKTQKIKIIDFGLAREIDSKPVLELQGTPEFVAPKIVNYDPLSFATDMWSVGIITFIMLTGFSPFHGESRNETFNNIIRCELDLEDEHCSTISDLVKQFLSSLIVKTPASRLTSEQCLNHGWIRPEKKNIERKRNSFITKDRLSKLYDFVVSPSRPASMIHLDGNSNTISSRLSLPASTFNVTEIVTENLI